MNGGGVIHGFEMDNVSFDIAINNRFLATNKCYFLSKITKY